MKRALVVGQVSVDPGHGNLAVESRAFQWRPATLVQDVFLAHGPLAVEIYEGQVRKIAFSNVSSFLDAVEDGGIVAHFLYDLFQADFALVVKLQ